MANKKKASQKKVARKKTTGKASTPKKAAIKKTDEKSQASNEAVAKTKEGVERMIAREAITDATYQPICVEENNKNLGPALASEEDAYAVADKHRDTTGHVVDVITNE